MKPEEFDALAERVLHSLLSTERFSGEFLGLDEGPRLVAWLSVDLAEQFVLALKERRVRLSKPGDLLPEEILEIQSGNLIAAIKMLRDRCPGLSLKEAKACVDKFR